MDTVHAFVDTMNVSNYEYDKGALGGDDWRLHAGLGGGIREGFQEEVTYELKFEAAGQHLPRTHTSLPLEGPGQRSRLASMLDSDTEAEGDIGGTINPSVAMAIAGGPLAPGSRSSISQGPASVSTGLVSRDTLQPCNGSSVMRF